MKANLAIALILVSLALGCATTRQGPRDLEVQKVATAKLTNEEACQKMKKFHEGTVRATLEFSKQNGADDSLVMKTLRYECKGYAMIAETLISAVVDGESIAVISVAGLRINPDGSVEGKILGVIQVDQSKSIQRQPT